MKVVGIDPGLDGAVALVTEYGALEVHDLPTIGGGPGGRRQVDPIAWRNLLISFGAVTMVVAEQVHAMADNGSQTAFSQGDTWGTIRSVTMAFDRPFTYLSPAAWHKAVGRLKLERKAGKEWARAKVRAEHPQIADQLTRKMDADRAEAVLIAQAWLIGQRKGVAA